MEEHPDVGKRVELVWTSDPCTNLKPGNRGIVFSVDALGTRHIKWDNGSNLGLIPGVDKWKELGDEIKAE